MNFLMGAEKFGREMSFTTNYTNENACMRFDVLLVLVVELNFDFAVATLSQWLLSIMMNLNHVAFSFRRLINWFLTQSTFLFVSIQHFSMLVEAMPPESGSIMKLHTTDSAHDVTSRLIPR
jgi:hypothetical protein